MNKAAHSLLERWNIHGFGSLCDFQDNFQLLRIDKRFNIDTKTLTKQFRQIQNVLHPDKFSRRWARWLHYKCNCITNHKRFSHFNSSEKEQHLSAEWSSLVNKAYKILLSPIQRAEYLLKAQNIEVSETNTTSNKQFLMDMMERNEEVMKSWTISSISVKWTNSLIFFLQVDEAESKEALIQLLAAVQKDQQSCIDKLETALSTSNLDDAKEQLIALRYLLSLENSIKEKGNRIGINLWNRTAQEGQFRI